MMVLIRYAIDSVDTDWKAAEEHVSALAAGRKGLGTVVSLKSGGGERERERKRKAVDGEGGKEHHKTRRGGKKVKR
jgi:hypothetical protein